MNNKKFIYIYLILLPIIDLITSLTTRFSNNPISIGIIIKMFFLAIMLISLFFSTSKYKKKSLIYLFIIFIYMLFYILSKIQYLTLSNLVTELMYLFKFSYLPILIICLICYFDSKKISTKEIKNILFINALTYIILLLIPLITKTSFSTYEVNDRGSIGWFYAANEVSVIVSLLYPYLFDKIKNKKNIVLIIIGALLFLLIDTKVSILGILITTIIIFILGLFQKNKRLIINLSIVLISTLIIFFNNDITNKIVATRTISEKTTQETYRNDSTNIPENKDYKSTEDWQQIEKEYAAIKEKDKENLENSKLPNFIKKIISFGKSILSSRDIYLKQTYKIYKNNFNINTLLFGLGYSNNYDLVGNTKLIEMDPLDIFFHSGLIALIIMMLPFIYFIIKLLKKGKITKELIFYTLMLTMIFAISCISGHTLMAPAVSIYIALYFILAFTKLNIISEKKDKIEKGKVTIYALHLNYGGVEKNICTKANLLSQLYNVEIISLYKLNSKPVFDLNKNIKIKYLTTNIKPNRIEFNKAIKSKKIINIIKEGLYSLKVLYLKNNLITKSMIECNSEIIISTRIDFTEKLIKNNEYNNIKIAEEHIYHNNNKKYLKRLNKILNKVDYLMPSSDYLTNYYKDKYVKYAYKIYTNRMPIETDNTLSKLTNKSIISVGRLSKEKGYEDLVKLFSKTEHNDWILNIVGDGPEYDKLAKLINDLDLKDKVILHGFKTTEELNKLYRESSIYIMTSFEESFGLVLLEAASHGLPIIAYSSALGACEILSNNNGILINDRNESNMIKALNELMNEKELRNTYQKKSLNISKCYSYKNIENDNIEFFNNLIRTNIYNNLYVKSKEECYKLIEKKLKEKEKKFIVTANPETYMLSESDLEINSILYNKDNLIVPDGIAIVKTANYLGYNIKERITGVDLAEYLFDLANKNKYKVYLFGASIEVIEKLENVIKENYPNIKLVGASNGYIKDKDSVMEYIKTTKPDIVMLALGIPLQEKLINKHINDFNKGIFIGVGGSFDVISGTKKRAPKIFIKLNLEWFYRIMSEPKRIKRFIKYNMKFLIKIFKEKTRN